MTLVIAHTDPAALIARCEAAGVSTARGLPLRLYRLRLDPGEGYIAPTELLPHDGSTEDQDQPSTAAFWLGHWPRGTLTQLV
ncbi:hypothetical protein ACFZDG_33880 [Kitasatospora xanthocidica]|uniref:hypothetical protein n=1 Tax=Kitasatospora xanthocidica TaxID=83382 RepID=UPI0036F06D82